jgi:glycosidase
MNRFLWVARSDLRKLRLAALCQFTLIGAPVVYYGTEVGLSQHNDVMQQGRAIHEEARLPMIWGTEQDRDLFAFYKGLIALRKAHSALRHGTRTNIHMDDKTLAYRRSDGTENLVTILNLSEQETSLELELTESTSVFTTGPECRLQDKERVKRVTLPAFGGMILN